MPNKRLGRGINALIQSREEQEKKEQSGVNKLSIISIKPNPNQPRHDFDETAMEELISSIKEKGVLTPITVQKVNNQFILVAGERRLRQVRGLSGRTSEAVSDLSLHSRAEAGGPAYGAAMCGLSGGGGAAQDSQLHAAAA